MSRATLESRRRSTVAIEPLEQRRLLSVVAAITPLGHPAPPATAHGVAAPPHRTPSTPARVHALDDDGGDDGGDDSDSDSGGDGSATGPSDGGSDDSGGTSGGATTAPYSPPDDGNGFDNGSSGGSFGNDPVTPVPTPPTTDPGDDATPANGGSADAGTTDNGTPDHSLSDTGLPADQATVLYPTGDPGDDDLYDAGAGDDGDGFPVFAAGPNFGGTLHVRLPADPVPGDAGVATVDVFNTGARAVGRLRIALGLSPDGAADDAVHVADDTVAVHLGHDRVTTYRIPFRLPTTLPPGTYRELALIDAGNAFGETDESDNVALGDMVTVAAAVPDVTATALSAPARLRAGRPAAVTLHLRDVGSAAVTGSTTLTVVATPVGSTAPPTVLATVTRTVKLKAGQRSAVPVRLTMPVLPPGRYQLTATVTPTSAADVSAADKSAVTDVTVSG